MSQVGVLLENIWHYNRIMFCKIKISIYSVNVAMIFDTDEIDYCYLVKNYQLDSVGAVILMSFSNTLTL